MDNNEHNNGHDNHFNSGFIHRLFDAHPQLGRTFHDFVNAFVPQHHTQHPQPPAADDPDMADLPPLEYVSRRLSSSPTESREQMRSSVDASSSTSPIRHVQSPEPTTAPPTRPREQSLDYESDPLVSVSVSPDIVHTSDVEMSEPDDASQRRSASSASRSSRRVRVEDDEDEDEVRETNRQRMHSPLPHDEDSGYRYHLPRDARQTAPHPPNQPPTSGHGAVPSGPPPSFNRLVYTFEFFPQFPGTPVPANNGPGTAQTSDQPQPQPQGQTNQSHPHPHPPHTPGIPLFNFTFHLPVVPGPGPVNHAGQDGNTEQNAAGNPPQGIPDFAQFLQQLMGGEGGPAMFPFGFHLPSFMHEEERDDPERATRLVNGLEIVPAGLVKRMERVGGSGTSVGEAPVCAICWESLLDPPGSDDAPADQTESQASSEASMNLDESSAVPTNQPDSVGSSSEPNAVQDDRIVVLPCSHVFHASCLLPWFSKPHRTTCPSCRFDIDPDSLTYVPRPRRSRRAAAGQAPTGPQRQTTQAETGTQASPQPVPGFPLGGAPGGAPDAGPGQDQNRAHRPPLSPFVALDFSMFIPVGPIPPPPMPHGQAQAQPQPQARGQPQQPRAGPMPQFMRLDEQSTRALFDRIFGSGPQPQGQPAGAAPGAAVPPPARPMTAPPSPRPAGTDAAPPSRPTGTDNTAPPQPGARREKRRWSLPAAPGPTLRQRIERREREMGLRCSDPTCGLGPSDEDPAPVVDESALRQIHIRPLKGHGEGDRVCEHSFHPACLVRAERVAGWSPEDKKRNENEDEVEVSCPVCRAIGYISREDWEEGARALV